MHHGPARLWVVEERFPGELETLRADHVRLRRLLKLSEEQARAADPDQAALTGASTAPVDMGSTPHDKIRFYADLFRCRTDVYAVRGENKRDGRSGWMPVIRGCWRKGMKGEDAPYLRLTHEVIGKHLRGDHHIGLYPLADDDTCWWVAADFDRDSAMPDALVYLKPARAQDVPAALEVSQSGHGGQGLRANNRDHASRSSAYGSDRRLIHHRTTTDRGHHPQSLFGTHRMREAAGFPLGPTPFGSAEPGPDS